MQFLAAHFNTMPYLVRATRTGINQPQVGVESGCREILRAKVMRK